MYRGLGIGSMRERIGLVISGNVYCGYLGVVSDIVDVKRGCGALVRSPMRAPRNSFIFVAVGRPSSHHHGYNPITFRCLPSN